MKKKSSVWGIGVAVAVIMATVAWLAYTGFNSSKSFYVTIAELGGLGDKAYKSHLRLEGYVQPGSIQQSGPHAVFVLNEYESHTDKAPQGRLLKVNYTGSEPPPDAFKDDAQVLAEGTYGRDGVFHATTMQAKCASKYEPTQPGAAPAAPSKTAPKEKTRASSTHPATGNAAALSSTGK